MTKKNTFLDFVTCAEYLQHLGITTADTTAAIGEKIYLIDPGGDGNGRMDGLTNEHYIWVCHSCNNKIHIVCLITLTGRSAGGMLIGASLNLRPELFKVAVAEVPFLDVLNSVG